MIKSKSHFEPALPPDAIHVWRVPLLATPEKIREFASFLAPDETTRAGRFHFERDRNRYILGRGTLRVLLSRYLHKTPQSLRFDYSPYGKPALREDTNPSFNLAHSGDLALYAFAQNRQIGIDLEQIRDDVDCDDLAKHYFTQREIAAYFALPNAERRPAFFRIWTRKEAYLKAHGEGLALPLADFDVSHESEDARLLATRPDSAEAARWRMTNLTTDAGFAAALATSGPEFHLAFFTI